MLYQLHWQNPDPEHCTETIFVAQSHDVRSEADVIIMLSAFNEIIRCRKYECPERLSPMVCDEGYEGFVVTTTDPTQDAGSEM